MPRIADLNKPIPVVLQPLPVLNQAQGEALVQVVDVLADVTLEGVVGALLLQCQKRGGATSAQSNRSGSRASRGC